MTAQQVESPSPSPKAAYVGRFAPSPTGLLHAGSLVAALASWLDARAHQGQWLVRIEDVDQPRCIPGAAEQILRQLAACHLHSDGPVLWQSERYAAYQQALDTLVERGLAYPCTCSRKDIEAAQWALGHARERHAALPYPGTCRHGLQGRTGRSWRLDVEKSARKTTSPRNGIAETAIKTIATTFTLWQDRRLGPQQQNIAEEVGDFILRRADGLWAYQLAVVVDDAHQGITHIVRGEDLADNTPRQMLLQRALGTLTPSYLHTPLVLGQGGEKLSKQNGATALVLNDPIQALAALRDAAAALGLPPPPQTSSLPEAMAHWVQAWKALYNGAP